jgi:hypothetical protein
MTLILWSGKNGEMMFNRRRCSRDRAVIADILSMYAPADLCVSAYSASLFEGSCVIGDLADAKEKVLFLEDFPLLPALAQAQKIIVYRFDRTYPADIRLEIPQSFSLTESLDFSGFSHDKITREVYIK